MPDIPLMWLPAFLFVITFCLNLAGQKYVARLKRKLNA